MNQKQLDEIVRSVSAFKDFDDLMVSINDHDYTPTLWPEAFPEVEQQQQVQALRNHLIGMGKPVYPKALPTDHLPSVSVQEVASEDAESAGFAKFNGGRHLCVEVPDGHFTITAKTSEGKVVTFAFCPYEQGGPAQCVDVMHHHDGETFNDSPVQKLIAFSGGSNAYISRNHPYAPVTLTTHILKEEESQ